MESTVQCSSIEKRRTRCIMKTLLRNTENGNWFASQFPGSLGIMLKVLYLKPWENICQGSKKHIEKSPDSGRMKHGLCSVPGGGAEDLEALSEQGEGGQK